MDRSHDARRLTLKIAIGARLSSANEELELSIAVMSLALEMLVDHLFGEGITEDATKESAI